jgi:hypothetical protein
LKTALSKPTKNSQAKLLVDNHQYSVSVNVYRAVLAEALVTEGLELDGQKPSSNSAQSHKRYCAGYELSVAI